MKAGKRKLTGLFAAYFGASGDGVVAVDVVVLSAGVEDSVVFALAVWCMALWCVDA